MEMTQRTTPLGLEEEGFPLSVLESTLRSNISYKCCVMDPGIESDVDRRERGSTKVVWTHALGFAQGPLIKAIPNHPASRTDIPDPLSFVTHLAKC